MVATPAPLFFALVALFFVRLAAVHVTGFMDPTAAARLGNQLKRRDAADAAAGGATSWEVANGRGMESSGEDDDDDAFIFGTRF